MTLALETAQKKLEKFNCADIQSITQVEHPAQLREALQLVARASEYQMLGICADSLDQAFTALSQYLNGLGYTLTINPNAVESIEGSVYLKFNSRNQSYYVSPYRERYRGVLVSCQSSDEAGINGTYGHFPLDLFQ